MRRHHVKAALTLAFLPVTSALAQTPPLITTGGLPIGLDNIVTGLTGQPVAIDHAPDGTNRLFIATRTTGTVRLYDGSLQATPFLNLTTGGVTLSGGGEKGLLGMAFHPNFNASVGTPGRGKFYTYTSEAKGPPVNFTHPELGTLGDHDSVFREWTVADPTNFTTVDHGAGGRQLLRIRQPQANHNGGGIRFDSNGLLYIALGDGGGANDFEFGSNNMDPDDGHTSPGGNGQDTSNVYGKILRINPLDPDGAGAQTYSVPGSNPFVGVAGVDEIYAYGLRNPFQIHFDRGTGTLYAGDVGQGQREEVDIITSGANYGWVNMEGTRVNTTAIAQTAPIGEYTHSDGVAVIGGTVYRGNNIPELYGKYVFGELDGFGAPTGRLFYMNANGGTITEFTYLLNAPSATLHAFGEDRDGELYALFSSGTVSRLLGRQWLATIGGSWNTSGNWLAGVPNSVGANANFLGKIAANSTITLDGSKTVGALRFNNPTAGYTINAGTGGSLTINNGASAGLVHAIRGTHTINPSLLFATNSDIRIENGAALNITSMTINVGTTVTVQDGTPRVGTLANAAGKLDVRDQKFVITNMLIGSWDGSAYTRVIGMVASGRGDGTWNDNGIVTSMTDATTSVLTTVAIALASETGHAGGTFGGVSVTANDILIMYTWGGDADLDGDLDGDDYFYIDSNILANQSGANNASFHNGDFDYDGDIDGDDYFIIDSNILYAQSHGPLSSSLAAVPEPALLAPLAGLLLMRRRR